MGVDTKGYLNKEVGVVTIATLLTEIAENVYVEDTNYEDYSRINYDYKGEKRSLNVFTDYATEITGKDVCTHISLGRFGFANEVMYKIVSYFGGFYLADDCSMDSAIALEKTGDFTLSPLAEKEIEIMQKLAEYGVPVSARMGVIRFLKDNVVEVTELLSNYVED